jgi:hypothetical protein
MPDFNTLARIAKLIALLCFALPWIVVSCSGNEIAHGSGIDLMTGHLQPSHQIAGLQQQAGSDEGSRTLSKAGPEYVAIAAFVVIALGMVLGLLLRGRAASGAMLATALLGIGLSFGAFAHIQYALNDSTAREERRARGDEAGLQRSLEQSVQNAIQVDKKEGFWATIIALVVTATLSGAALTVRSAPAPAPAPPA